MNLKHSTLVTSEALPSRMRVTILEILKIVLVNGAAKLASSVESANPISADRNAQVSFVPSPQKARKLALSYFNRVIKSPL